jgi:putative phosphonate metabolism protein
MNPGEPRYAVYFAPPAASALWRFGCSVLGLDVETGEAPPLPALRRFDAETWRDITAEPRKYGFHGTLKAPMALAPGSTEAELAAACESFADTARPIPVIAPVVDSISGFIAVIPAQPSAELLQLAADVTREFDSFRAPLSPEDRARRNPARLTARQCDYLDRWGYPYVMEEFRFHMTLTGRLESERREPVMAMLRSRFVATGLTALAIDRIALFRQDDADSRFLIVTSCDLRPIRA